MALILVGCGRAKLSRAAPAKELYVGSLFRAGRRYAEASGDEWLIVSGKHGVISPERVIEPYDEGVPRKGGGEREAWAWRIGHRLRRYDPEFIELIMGRAYAEPLTSVLHWLGVRWSEPLTGMGLGHRIQWLKRAAESRPIVS